MGDAIARFREMALAIRRKADENHSQPLRAVAAAAAKKFAKECREHFLDHEKQGMPYPARYINGLCKRRREAERHPVTPRPGCLALPDYIEWLPEQFRGTGTYPRDSEIRAAVREAIREAVRWGSLFPAVEARILALDAAAEMLVQYAAVDRYSNNPPDEDFEVFPDGTTGYCRPTQFQADQDYIARHEKFAKALDALAPFIEEPTAPTATSEKMSGGTKQKKHRDRRGVGGRKKKYPEQFVRDVLAARRREEKACRRSKERLAPKAEWLRIYCRNRGIDTAKMFPHKDEAAPEPWDIRANRFWSAVKGRVRRAGN
jgi:hypothetical protein